MLTSLSVSCFFSLGGQGLRTEAQPVERGGASARGDLPDSHGTGKQMQTAIELATD